MNETPYTSIAYGTLELKGAWTRDAVDLLLPVLEGGGYFWGYLSLIGSVSPESPKAIFGGGGDMPLGQFLCEELYEMTEDDIRRAAPEAFPVRDGIISALASAMEQNHLEIEMRFTVKNLGEAEYHEVYTVGTDNQEFMGGVYLCGRTVSADRPPYSRRS